MKSIPSDSLAVNVWLQSPTNFAQSSVFCFRDRLLLEKRTNVMINSTSCGAIGVKDIVDALRLGPDEDKKETNGRDKIATTVQLAPGQMIQVLWVPASDLYAFHITSADKAVCGKSLKEIPAWKTPFLTLRGLEACSPVTIQRVPAEPGTDKVTVQVLVAEVCNSIQVDPKSVVRNHKGS